MTVLFTDIDGTLIDHHTYDADLTRNAVHALIDAGIPVVFCSSKTFAEQLYLQQQLGIRQPMIVENGAGVFFPEGYFDRTVIPVKAATDGYGMVPMARLDHAALRRALRQVSQEMQETLNGYGDVSDEVLASATGLQGAALHRARQRQFSETLLGVPPSEAARRRLQQQGIALSQGGRFVTLTDANVDKGKAVRTVASWFLETFGPPLTVVAVGDSPNDESMLRAADRAFLVKRHDGHWATMEVPELVRLDGVGPAGFLILAQTLLTGV